MISELAVILPSFSEVGHTRCFLHVINLVAKSIIRQFDIPKKQKDQHLNNAKQALQDLAGDVKLKEQMMIKALVQHQIDGKIGEVDTEIEPDDNKDGWVDEMTSLSPARCKQVKADICPVKLVLVKVSY
jgi:hypothetical protein